MTRFVAACLTLICLALPVRAEPDRLDALIEALAMDDILEIMRQEGIDYGEDLREEMFPGRGGAAWTATVARIYDGARIRAVMRAGLAQELEGTDLDPLIAFFTSETGARAIALEVRARRALLDDAVVEASRDALAAMRTRDDPRLALLTRFVRANDLLDFNVVGALNANYAFYVGLVDGGAFPFEITEEQMLSDVWSQEADVRLETEQWLYSYLAMAYDPLPDADLEAYIAISETPEGKALNRALFEAFDVLFRGISRELGLAAARLISGEDI
ncbi:DUF2059 domain-containing protein [Actibacterium sp. MT2.3-13A]|uniref:DUF2059 domain-containing protein n=1 Tax=Actibacterium sp. MT2.3-13A TaxID=2828332 RepID=UPI0020129590|nr:DUF2059 domain-containing protein [Actibacterium sp. MT2.3-13A]